MLTSSRALSHALSSVIMAESTWESAENYYYSALCSPVDSVSETSEYYSVPGESITTKKVETSRLNSRRDPTRLDLRENDPLPSILVISVLNELNGQQ